MAKARKNEDIADPYPNNGPNAVNNDDNTVDDGPNAVNNNGISKDEMMFFEKSPFILWDGIDNFSCKCPKGPLHGPFWKKFQAANHTKTHGYDIQGNIIPTITPIHPKTTIPVEQSQQTNEKLQKELEKLEQPNPEDILFSRVQEGVQTNLVSSIVNDLKDIAKDAEIMYVFQKLKTENKIPKNITFAAFVKDLLGYYCNKFGFNFMFYQDTTKLGPVELEIQKEIIKENMVK